MAKEHKRTYKKPKIKYLTDFNIVLECLHELYKQEKNILEETDIHNTILFPFLKMLEEQCKGITAEEIHEKIWDVSSLKRKEVFLETADKLLKPYRIV